jgi:hypothetical protein
LIAKSKGGFFVIKQQTKTFLADPDSLNTVTR